MSVIGNPITLGGSGAGNPFALVTGISNLYYSKRTTDKPIVPSKITLDLPYCENATYAFAQYIANDSYSLGIEEIEIIFYNPVQATNLMRRNTSIETAVFPSGIILESGYGDFLGSVIKSVVGKIGFEDASSANANTAFRTATVLEDIEFVENQIPFNAEFASTALTDASILSIANGLSESASAQTLTMPAAVKTRMNAMMGTVALDAETQTYHVFTQDAQGSVILSDFITNTKGWTLA